MIEKILLIYIANILNGCNRKNTADNSKKEETIYVDSGDYNISPFYNFYSDKDGKKQINENGILTLDSKKKYTFRRLYGALSHPFDIKINNMNEDLEGFELIKSGEYDNGIKGDDDLTVEFKNYQKNVEIIYYCTAHPTQMFKKIEFKS